MSDITQTFCFVLVAFCLGGCLIRAFWEVEAARERRREQKQFIRDAMRGVVTSTERGK
jgi:hypothetical protein